MGLEDKGCWRQVFVRAASALLFSVGAQTAVAKPAVAGLFVGIPAVGAVRQAPAATVTEQEARQLIAAEEANRGVLLAALASRQAEAFNREARRVHFTEAAVATMLRTLLAQRVAQQALPEHLSVQAHAYLLLMDRLKQLQGSLGGWTPMFEEIVGALRAGQFEAADGLLKETVEANLVARTAASSLRAQRDQARASLTELRGELAVVRFDSSEASRLYEHAAEMLPDEAGIEAAAWLLKSASWAYESQDPSRAMVLLKRVVGGAEHSMAQKSPFAEWPLLKWVGEAQSMLIQKTEGDSTEALRHFRLAVLTEDVLDTHALKSSEVAGVRWAIRNAAFEIYLSQGDMAAAKQAIPPMLEIARTMVGDLGDQPPALEALWASQLVGADMDRFDGQSAKALQGYLEALRSARRLVALRKSSRGSLLALRQSLQMFSNLPESVLSVDKALAYGKEWQVVASSVVALEPEHLISRRALWESHRYWVDVQVRKGNPGQALDDAAVLLNVALEMAADAPGRAQVLQSLLVSHEEVAKLKLVTGSKVAAIDHYGFAVEAARNSVRLMPGDNDAEVDLWRVLVDLGDAQQETVRHDEAWGNLQSALGLAMSAVEKPGADPKWLERAGYSWLKVATFQVAAGEMAKGQEAFAHSMNFERRFLKASTDSAGWSYNLWFALLHSGKALADLARYPEAMERQVASLKAAEGASQSESLRAEAVSCIWFSLREMGETMIKMGDLQGGLDKHRAAQGLANQQVRLVPASELWTSYARVSTGDVKRAERMLR